MSLASPKSQVTKAAAVSPQIFCLSLERNLKPKVQWLLDLGLGQIQVAKIISVFPPLFLQEPCKHIKQQILLQSVLGGEVQQK